MTDPTEIQKLIDLAVAALGEDDPERVVGGVEAYTDAFSAWYQEGGVRGTREEIERLNELHGLVLGLMDRMKSAVSKDLRKLKVHGKGILAYTDVLPKKISVRRHKKG